MKKTALTLLQIGVTVGILWLVFRDPAKRAEMFHALQSAQLSWLLAGLLVYGLVEIIAGIRWQLLLRVQGIHIGSGRVLMLLMIGVFFNFFVPGGTGGDVVKTFYLLKETPGQSTQALLSVLVDRIVGLFSLIVLAGVFIALRWDWLTTHSSTANCVWSALAILGVSFAGIAVSFVVTGAGLVHKLPAKMPGREKLAELALAYNLYGRAWRPTLAAFSLSVVAHLGYFATFYFAARALSTPAVPLPSLGEFCSIMPVVNTILAMPISFGGLGAREKLFEIMLGDLAGVPAGIAASISLTGYMLTLFWGLVGGLLYVLYRPSKHASFREMQTEVQALEHSAAEEEFALEMADDKAS